MLCTLLHHQFFFSLQSARTGHLRQVRLLHRYHHCYKLTEITVGHYEEKNGQYTLELTAKPEDVSYKAFPGADTGQMRVDITVGFSSTVFGSFSQCLLLDFGRKPYLVQRMNVDVCGEELSGQLDAIRQEVGEGHQRWDESSVELVRVVPTDHVAQQRDKLCKMYSVPAKVHNIVSAQLLTGSTDKRYYQRTMHQLLFIEEAYMRQKIARWVAMNDRDS